MDKENINKNKQPKENAGEKEQTENKKQASAKENINKKEQPENNTDKEKQMKDKDKGQIKAKEDTTKDGGKKEKAEDKKQDENNKNIEEKDQAEEAKEDTQPVNKIGILGEKLGMSQLFDDMGRVVPVSVVKVYNGTIIQIKTIEKEGYNALKVAFKEEKKEKLNKPLLGIFNKLKITPNKILKEFRTDNIDDCKIGDRILINQFGENSFIDVSGISKGKGFQGVLKKFNYKGGPKTRGQGNKWKTAGSIGAGSDPGKVWKGHNMPGRMGGEAKTIQSLKVMHIDKDKNLLLIKGSIPGPRNIIVQNKHSIKNKAGKNI